MIQIMRLGDFINNQGEKIVFAKATGHSFKNLKELFNQFDNIYPKDERTNLFYTVAHHLKGERKFSSWQAQDIIPFDLDGIDLARIDEYPTVACEALGIDKAKTGIVYTGNGIHLLVQVKLWKDKDYIKTNKLGYRQLYDRIVEACDQHNLPIVQDCTAWDYGRILRCPFTTNKKIKEGKEVFKKATLENDNIEIQTLELPTVTKPKTDFFIAKGSFATPDKNEVVKECKFFNWLKDEPDAVHEPHAYAMLSITGHFDDDNETSNEYWARFSSPSINSKDVVEFTEQALEMSGPRTCDGINDIWGKCKTCPHFGKVTSPIQLKSESFIGTANCGFTLKSAKGGKIRQYDDLKNFFNLKYNFKTVSSTGAVYTFNVSHYEQMSETEIKNFAQSHFSSPVKESERVEFLKLVQATNIVKDTNFFDDVLGTTKGKINFSNGVLNIETGELAEHSKDFFFFNCLPYGYDANATAPMFEQFLSDITLGRKGLTNTLLEYMGYCVGGSEYKYAKALILSGSGKNGKSTLVNVIRDLVGAQNCAAMSITAMNNNNFLASGLQHKLVNISEEEPPSCFRETSLFKTITGNSEIMVEKKFQNAFMMRNRAKIILTYNEMPFISDSSIGMRRRLLVVPFDFNLEAHPELVDANLQEKFKGELSGIFNLAFEGLKRLEMNEGFTEDETTNEAVDDVMTSANSVLRWFKEDVVLTNNQENVVAINEMFIQYRNFMDDEGEKFIVGRRKFTAEIKNYLTRKLKTDLVYSRKRVNGKIVRVFSGIKLENTVDF